MSGGKISELALHYANKRGLMLVRLVSKFDVRRLCQATGATVLPTLTIPSPEELGFIERVRIDEIADTNVVIFEQGMAPSLLFMFHRTHRSVSAYFRLKQEAHGHAGNPWQH